MNSKAMLRHEPNSAQPLLPKVFGQYMWPTTSRSHARPCHGSTRRRRRCFAVRPVQSGLGVKSLVALVKYWTATVAALCGFFSRPLRWPFKKVATTAPAAPHNDRATRPLKHAETWTPKKGAIVYRTEANISATNTRRRLRKLVRDTTTSSLVGRVATNALRLADKLAGQLTG